MTDTDYCDRGPCWHSAGHPGRCMQDGEPVEDSPIAPDSVGSVEAGRAEVVCICGSTRFRAQIVEATRLLTMAGKVVLAPGVFGHDGDPLTDADKEALDALHFRKIDMADRVVVVAPGGYIGSSTSREVTYAERQGKSVETWGVEHIPVAAEPTVTAAQTLYEEAKRLDGTGLTRLVAGIRYAAALIKGDDHA